MLFLEQFDRCTELNPDRVCVLEPGGRSLSYQECSQLSMRIAEGIRNAGVLPGESVGMLGDNHVLTLPATLGVFRSAAVWLPVNARNSVDETVQILVQGRCRLLLLHSSHQHCLEALARALPGLTIVCIDRDSGAVPSLEAWVPPLHACANKVHARDAEDVVAIRGTGGTTGLPKGVQVTGRMMDAMFAGFNAMLPLEAPPVHLVVTPMTHAAGSLGLMLSAHGATQVVLAGRQPQEILEAIEAYQVNVLFLPPTLIYRLLEYPRVRDYIYSSLKYFIYAAAPMSVSRLKRALSVFGPVMVQLYGQAEAPMFCTCLSVDDHLAALGSGDDTRLSSCGKASPLLDVELMNDEGGFVDAGQAGEIVVRGDLVMTGYSGSPEKTAEALQGGWLHTGDLAWRDADGYIYIVDRKKDIIISGGFNIYPAQIEQVLLQHPAVLECAVIGVPDPEWGEAVKAVVELADTVDTSPEDLRHYCRERLGGMKAPKTVDIWPQLPRSAVGKVLKSDIRKQFWAGHTRNV